jgi:hypothetical protein
MIDSILNLIFRCSHRRLTRPLAPVARAGQAPGGSYVVCLDCGKQFEYDLREMRIGKAIDRSHDANLIEPVLPVTRKRMVKFALFGAVPAAVVIGAVWKAGKKVWKPAERKPAGPKAG